MGGGELDETTIRAFLDEEYPRVVAAVAMVSDSRPAAEDAVCEALARAWERSERGERVESLGAWVTTVAMNLSRTPRPHVRGDLGQGNGMGDEPALGHRKDQAGPHHEGSHRKASTEQEHYQAALPSAGRLFVSQTRPQPPLGPSARHR